MIAAIPTTYRGITYRSRLEARWAVFFSTLNLAYEYELDRFNLDQLKDDERDTEQKNILYTPDFLIPKQRLFSRPMWVEVKGNFQDIDGLAMLRLTVTTKIEGLIIGSIPQLPKNVCEWGRSDAESWAGSLEWSSAYPNCGDIGHFFCECPHCGSFGYEFWCRADRLNCCDSGRSHHKNYHMGNKIPDAISVASSYKFEGPR
jgi:hypothetical protein